jgi:hypothetical protein
MSHKIKKHWKQPTILVLVRGSREEGVLVSCKATFDNGTNGPLGLAIGCGDIGAGCIFCDVTAAS